MSISNVPIFAPDGWRRISQKLRVMFSFKISKLVLMLCTYYSLSTSVHGQGPWSLLVTCAYISCPHILTIVCCSYIAHISCSYILHLNTLLVHTLLDNCLLFSSSDPSPPKSRPPILNSQHRMQISESTLAWLSCVRWLKCNKDSSGNWRRNGGRLLFCPSTTIGWC